MARTPDTVSISTHLLMLLLNFRWAAVQSVQIGELGEKAHHDFVAEIDRQSKVEVKPAQLADMIHHMKEVVFEKVPFVKPDKQIKNHNKLMRKLKAEVPYLFKELPTGEVVMVELEERVWNS